MKKVRWSAWSVLAGALFAASTVVAAQEDEPVSLVGNLKAENVTLQKALTAAAAKGTPTSATYTYVKGKLLLTVFVTRTDEYFAVAVNPSTGKVTGSTKITDEEELEAAKTQSKAMDKGNGAALVDALDKSLTANAGYRAVAVRAGMVQGAAVAKIVLMKGSDFQETTQPLK